MVKQRNLSSSCRPGMCSLAFPPTIADATLEIQGISRNVQNAMRSLSKSVIEPLENSPRVTNSLPSATPSSLAAEPSHLRLRHGAPGTRLPRTKFIFRLNHPVPCAAHTSRTAMIFFCNCRIGRRFAAAAASLCCSHPARTPRPNPRGFVPPTTLPPTLLRCAHCSPRALVTGQWCCSRCRAAVRNLLLQHAGVAAAAPRAAAAAGGVDGRKFPRPARQERAGRRLWGARAERIG